MRTKVYFLPPYLHHNFQEKFNDCNNIFVLGHGGNLAVADHAAVDISRLSNGTKNAQCPGSATVVTSLINDTNFDQWMVQWLRQVTSTMTEAQKKKCLIFGISSSGGSRDLIKASPPNFESLIDNVSKLSSFSIFIAS